MAATMLTITVAEHAAHSLPASLEQRLKCGSPTKTPDELADALEKHTAQAAKLRSAHLEAVRDRAARESQRLQEAAARKLRLAAQRVDKVQRKLFTSESKANAKKEATEAERDARKARREQLALAVAEARSTAAKTRAARQAALQEAEKSASAKHAKTVQTIVDKAQWQVKHAIAVAAAHKEKERADALAAGEKLAERLELAAGRRVLTPAFSPGTSAAVPPAAAVRHRVLNNDKVSCLQRKKQLEALMDKAASKREAFLQGVSEKAGAENARVATVVAAGKERDAGTDGATAASKAAMYERLLRAEVARLTALKHKYAPAHARGDTVSVIVVKVDKTHRMPPPALSLRLGTVSSNLLATAAARQMGAASRRAALRAQAALAAAGAAQRRAAALARIGKARALIEASARAREARSVVTLGLSQGRKLALVARQNERVAAAARRRAAAAKALLERSQAHATAVQAAAERRAAKARTVAKTGVVAVRAAANKSRRDASAAALAARGERLSARCAAAADARAGVLAARVALAQKRMKAAHPKTVEAPAEVA